MDLLSCWRYFNASDLKVVFQTQLDLARVVWSVARGAEEGKGVGGREVQASRLAEVGFERNIPSLRHSSVRGYAQSQNIGHFHLDIFARKAKLRNAQIVHASRHWSRFKDRIGITEQRQIVSAGKPADAGSPNRDLLATDNSPSALLNKAAALCVATSADEQRDGTAVKPCVLGTCGAKPPFKTGSLDRNRARRRPYRQIIFSRAEVRRTIHRLRRSYRTLPIAPQSARERTVGRFLQRIA
jgi:hypothetical protein